MDAIELRIGNIINVKHHNNDSPNPSKFDIPCELIAISKDEVTLATFQRVELGYCSGIPLTEEWLLKFGFWSKYKSVHMHWCKNDTPEIGTFSLDQKSNEDDEGTIIPQEQVFYFDHMLEVKYVHQLQNLYFAWMEQELKLKNDFVCKD